MPMMSWGMFVFELASAPFQDSQRQVGWRHPSASRVGDRPARQFVGADDDTRTLSGVLYPELTGGHGALAKLEELGNAGESAPLLDGYGNVLGSYVLESLHYTDKNLLDDGLARQIEFQLTLKRVDDNPTTAGGTTSAGGGWDLGDWLGLLG